MRKIIYIFLFFFLKSNSFAIENNILNDISVGNDDAKVIIYTYSSLTCPHCASFHNEIYPLLKKDFVDTGILKIYFKHFPLDLAALNAAKILQCVDEKNRMPLLDHLYKTQENWTKGEKIEDINQNLQNTIKNFGLVEIDFNKCLAFEDIENYILNTRIDAVKNFRINSTPTIIINNKKFEGMLNYKNLKKTIEKLI